MGLIAVTYIGKKMLNFMFDHLDLTDHLKESKKKNQSLSIIYDVRSVSIHYASSLVVKVYVKTKLSFSLEIPNPYARS